MASNARQLMSSDVKTNHRQSIDYDDYREDFQIPQVKYNIPQEYLQESSSQPQMMMPQAALYEPKENTKPVGVPTVEAIKNSKLPDDIKKLMMEHPISQPQQQSPTLSNDLIERASRLMNEEKGYIPESAKNKPNNNTNSVSQNNSGIDYNLIKKMINEAVKNALKENGLLTESSEKSNEIFSFKVGKHVFEGKVTKIKKLQ